MTFERHRKVPRCRRPSRTGRSHEARYSWLPWGDVAVAFEAMPGCEAALRGPPVPNRGPLETRSAASLLALCCRLTSVRAVDPLPEVPGVSVSRLNLSGHVVSVFRKFLMRLRQALLLLRLARSCRNEENPSRSNACFRASQFLQTGHPARTRGDEHARRTKRGAVAAGRSAVAV
jgi:hypothetical protein